MTVLNTHRLIPDDTRTDPLTMTPAHYRLLVVDDNDMNLDMLSRRLMMQKYQVDTAANGRQALEMIHRNGYDLLLLDIMMPEMDGYAVLSAIKENERLQDLPIIMITAITDGESVARCLEQGADDYLTKPFESVVLNARVRASLHKRRMMQLERHVRLRTEVEREELAQQVHFQVQALTRSNMAVIFALSKLAESRDPETGQHLERVQAYCGVLARALRQRPVYASMIDDRFVENIIAASPLHDIGKVGVPDRVLLKPGRLTKEEWELMRLHPALGAETLREVDRAHPGNDFIRYGIEIAEFHHEKWDGTGYPHGLQGTKIPLMARIMALADVYDALRSQRVYKAGMSHGKTRAIFLEERGNHFEPEIVDAFLDVESAFIDIHTIHQDPIDAHQAPSFEQLR
jgi:putative two-component system response regulator